MSFKIEERNSIFQVLHEKACTIVIPSCSQIFLHFAQYLRDRVFQCERCFYLFDHDGHTDLFSHYGYKMQQDVQATKASKKVSKACDPRDLAVSHGFLPNPTLDFSSLET